LFLAVPSSYRIGGSVDQVSEGSRGTTISLGWQNGFLYCGLEQTCGGGGGGGGMVNYGGETDTIK